MLFLVEFADWNGERIGRGCSTSNSKMNNGQTDAMGYHTGTTAANRDSYGFTLSVRLHHSDSKRS